jgi:hypothetical protein
MPSSGAFWRIRRHSRAAPLDKEEPRTPFGRSSAWPRPDWARTAGDDEITPLSRRDVQRSLVYADTRDTQAEPLGEV